MKIYGNGKQIHGTDYILRQRHFFYLLKMKCLDLNGMTLTFNPLPLTVYKLSTTFVEIRLILNKLA